MIYTRREWKECWYQIVYDSKNECRDKYLLKEVESIITELIKNILSDETD